MVGLMGCQTQKPEDPLKQTDASTHYASLLQMQDVNDSTTLCRIMNPWQTERVAIQYLLVRGDGPSGNESESLEQKFGKFQMLSVPLQRQTLTNSCHAWLLNELGATGSIRVMCDADFVRVPQVSQRLFSGEILDGGNSMAPNAEVIMAAGSDAIWISPYEATSQQIVASTMPDLPIIYCADYMETGPLARAEWIRFYGRLVGEAEQADSVFAVVEANYLSLSANTQNPQLTTQNPKLTTLSILSDLPYGATWYVPAGRSTMGQMFRDAGFDYAWSDDVHGGSLSLSPEAVFEKAHDADVWVMKYNMQEGDMTMGNLLAESELFGQFKAAQTGFMYGCNTAVSDYFDSTPFRPDVLLRELQMVQRQMDDSLQYFKRLR